MARPVGILLYALAGILALLVVGAAVLLLLPDSVYRHWVVQGVGAATGRTLSIDGDFKLDVGSTLSLSVGGVGLANADWADGSKMFTVDALSVEVAMWPLLRGVLDFRLQARSPHLSLETDASGRSNWDVGTATSDREWDPDGGFPFRLLPEEVDITDARVSIVDASLGTDRKAVLESVKFGVDKGALSLAVSGTIDGHPATLDGHLGEIDRIRGGERTDVGVEGKLGGLSWTTRGTWAKFFSTEGPTLDLEVDATLGLTGFIQTVLGLPAPELGTLHARGKIAGEGGRYAAKDLNAEVSGGLLTGTVQGTLGDITALKGFDLKAQLSTAKLPEIVAGFGLKLPVDLPRSLKATGAVTGSIQALALKDFKGHLEDEQVKGEVTGSVTNLLTREGLEADIDVQATSLARVSRFTGRDLPDVGPATVKARLTFADGVYKLTGIDASVTGDKLSAEVKGAIADLRRVSGLDLEVEGKAGSLSHLSTLLGSDLPETGALKLTARLSADQGATQPSKLKAQIESDLLRVDAEGEIASMTSLDGVRLEIEAETKSLAELGDEIGVPFKGIGQTLANFTLVTEPGQIKAEDVDLVLGASDLKGSVQVTLPAGGRRSAVSGRFQSKNFDLNDLLAIDDYVASRTQSNQKIEETGVVPESSRKMIFSDEPLPVAMLNEIDVDLEVEAERMEVGNIQINNARATLKLQAGDLKLILHQAKVGGRPIDGQLLLDAAKQPTPVQLRIDADNVPLSNLLGSGALLQGGRFLLQLSLAGQGNSMRSIMAGLNGVARSVVQDSRMPTSLFARFGRSVVSQLNPFAAERGYSNVDCAAVDLQIKDGMATTPRGMIFQTREVTWAGAGSINLDTQKIDFKVQSKARKGLGISAGAIADLMHFGGTLANPTLEPDPAGALVHGFEAALAVGTGGLTLVAKGLFDRATAETGLCNELVEEFEARPMTATGTAR